MANNKIANKKIIGIWQGDYRSLHSYKDFYINEGVVISDFFTEEDLHLENIDGLPNLYLDKCKMKNLILKNCNISSIYIGEHSEIGNILFYDGTEVCNLSINHSKAGFISITENVSVSNLHIKSSRTGYIDIDNSNIDSILIQGSSDVDYLSLNTLSTSKNIAVKGSKIGDINLASSSVIENIIIADAANIKNISIADASAIGNVEIENSNTKNITIENSSVQDLLVSGSGCGSLFMSNETTIRNLRIDKSKTKSILIDNSQTKNIICQNYADCESITLNSYSTSGYIQFEGQSVSKYISIDSSQTSYISVKQNSQIEYIWIDNSSTTGAISVYKATVSAIQIKRSSRVYGIILEYLTQESKQLSIQSSYIDKLILELDKPYQMLIKEYSEISVFHLDGRVLAKDIFLHISDTALNEFVFDSFLNQGIIVLNNVFSLNTYSRFKSYESSPIFTDKGEYEFEEVDKKSILKIVNSDLGKTEFIGCNLESFDSFVFLNSKLLQVFVADTLLPQKDKIGTVDRECEPSLGRYLFYRELLQISGPKNTIRENNEKLLSLLEQQRLALSQFKKIYENRGDVVKAIEYHADELETYRQYLKVLPNKKGKEAWNNRSERFNLFLNRYSSYYGNNWLRSVVTTLIINSILFTLYCFALGFKFGNDYNLFGKLASYSFEFLNPLRKADFLVNLIEPTTLSRFVDYLSRIIIAYFVYQTIQAFRKFGKKSI